MIPEEAINELRDASDSEVRYGDTERHYNEVMKRVEAFDMAIKALEQQPCEDCISRKAVKEQMIKYGFKAPDMTVTEFVEDCLPSVAPKSLELKDVLDSIKAEILDEAEYAYADFDEYKADILYADPDELPDDDFRYGMERAVEIINKYKAHVADINVGKMAESEENA